MCVYVCLSECKCVFVCKCCVNVLYMCSFRTCFLLPSGLILHPFLIPSVSPAYSIEDPKPLFVLFSTASPMSILPFSFYFDNPPRISGRCEPRVRRALLTYQFTTRRAFLKNSPVRFAQVSSKNDPPTPLLRHSLVHWFSPLQLSPRSVTLLPIPPSLSGYSAQSPRALFSPLRHLLFFSNFDAAFFSTLSAKMSCSFSTCSAKMCGTVSNESWRLLAHERAGCAKALALVNDWEVPHGKIHHCRWQPPYAKHFS